METIKTVMQRSHVKSKNGCQACKRKRVKCDEFRPTCRKCLLTGSECQYYRPHAVEASDALEPLCWPAHIEQSCMQWKETGYPPFPTLKIATSLGLAVSVLDISGTSDMCLLLGEFRTMSQLATSFSFVAHMLAAASAERLAIRAKSHQASVDAYRYHTLALSGLRQAMQSFSKSNADAILAAALGCSYQMPDCRSLMAIVDCISQAAYQMRTWFKESVFYSLFEYDLRYKTEETGSTPSHKPNRIAENKIRDAFATQLFVEGINAMNRLTICFKQNQSIAAVTRQLRDVLTITHEGCQTDIPAKEQYRLIYPFTAWFTKNSAASFIDLSNGDPLLFLFLAHMYAVVVTLVVALPEIDYPFFASMRLKGILAIYNKMERGSWFTCAACHAFHSFDQMMYFPLRTVEVYQILGPYIKDGNI
ncbi:hypothetical protein M441DRAFT_79471 [Trichoderma asperellum CBS 433.97]|uniref:Zn(2)-C6 fungal-type domain-containing protein n=2 Tax=Trichoderma asperellum TaxID=101201 RepID=A0A2T3Z927_TRIA4|nr:hypothetical protein M441DRAFT_79471 [Trichoderma asperellum CBS 433.97]PTB41311.1 hypothetical protein M441DRAFT_79471 [Trichoderma asperellum CBS 433.97]